MGEGMQAVERARAAAQDRAGTERGVSASTGRLVGLPSDGFDVEVTGLVPGGRWEQTSGMRMPCL
jgi:hypothetical protein